MRLSVQVQPPALQPCKSKTAAVLGCAGQPHQLRSSSVHMHYPRHTAEQSKHRDGVPLGLLSDLDKTKGLTVKILSALLTGRGSSPSHCLSLRWWLYHRDPCVFLHQTALQQACRCWEGFLYSHIPVNCGQPAQTVHSNAAWMEWWRKAEIIFLPSVSWGLNHKHTLST